MWRIVGGIAIGLFVVYVTSIAWSIMKGRMTAPELSDSDSDGDNDSENERSSDRGDHNAQSANGSIEGAATTSAVETSVARDTVHSDNTPDVSIGGLAGSSNPTVDADRFDSAAARNLEASQSPSSNSATSGNYERSVTYHIGFLVLGLLAILLSSYVLSHAASNLIDVFGVSDVLFRRRHTLHSHHATGKIRRRYQRIPRPHRHLDRQHGRQQHIPPEPMHGYLMGQHWGIV